MPPRDWTLRVEDLLTAIRRIGDYTRGMDYKSFCADQKTIDAVIRNFSVIGEAARHIPPEIQDAHAEIPWREMRDMRNIVVHGYFQVDLSILWQTIRDDLDPLVVPLSNLLKDSEAH